jgi:hypothetical protein
MRFDVKISVTNLGLGERYIYFNKTEAVMLRFAQKPVNLAENIRPEFYGSSLRCNSFNVRFAASIEHTIFIGCSTCITFE